MALNRQSSFLLDSEYKRLRTVILYKPGPKISAIDSPKKVLHLAKIEYDRIQRQFVELITAFEKHGVKVILVDDSPIGEGTNDHLFNMMYCRDLLFATPYGAIVANMAPAVRKNETDYILRTLNQSGISVLGRIKEPGTFEGADALWVTESTVIVGTGSRTNKEGFAQLKDLLEPFGVKCISFEMRQRATQHLLGVLQLIDAKLALIRSELIGDDICSFLEDLGIKLISVPENEEVKKYQAMNIVTIAPRSIFMANQCPKTKNLFLSSGLEVAAEVDIGELIKGAGGLACATSTIRRDGD